MYRFKFKYSDLGRAQGLNRRFDAQNVYFANNTMAFNGPTGAEGAFWDLGAPSADLAGGLTFQNNIMGQLNGTAVPSRRFYCGIGNPRPPQNKTLEIMYTIEYSQVVKNPTKVPAPLKRIHAVFYASESGNEPVKEALLELGRPTKTIVGEDVRFVELNWRVDRPHVDRLRSGRGEFEETLYEVRHTVVDIEYRTLFFISGSQMVLVHFFKKTSQKTPKSDLDLGWERMKKWIRADKENQRKVNKEKKSHAQKK